MYARWYRRRRTVAGAVREDKRLTVAFKDKDGGEHTLTGFTDEGVTDDFCANLDRLIACRVSGVALDGELIAWVERLEKDRRAALAAAGILDAARAQGARELAEQVEDFAAALAAQGATAKHVQGTQNRVKAIVNGCGFKHWSEITAGKVQGHLAELRKPKPKPGGNTGRRRTQ